jgi:hypothetical protein
MLGASGPAGGERVFGLSRPGRQVAAGDHFEGHFEGQNAASCCRRAGGAGGAATGVTHPRVRGNTDARRAADELARAERATLTKAIVDWQ